jgi:hypothetical protein
MDGTTENRKTSRPAALFHGHPGIPRHDARSNLNRK